MTLFFWNNIYVPFKDQTQTPNSFMKVTYKLQNPTSISLNQTPKYGQKLRVTWKKKSRTQKVSVYIENSTHVHDPLKNQTQSSNSFMNITQTLQNPPKLHLLKSWVFLANLKKKSRTHKISVVKRRWRKKGKRKSIKYQR